MTPVEKAVPDAAVVAERLVARHGEQHRARIERGVRQAAALWREEDGSFANVAEQQLVVDARELDATFERFESVTEQLDGNFLEAGRTLRWGVDVDGPLRPVDTLMAEVDPSAHLAEDLFRSHVAFAALLNFPLTSLDERLREGSSYDRRRWAEVRLAGRFKTRVPGEVRQAEAKAQARAELFVSQYNLVMHHVLDEHGQRLFPKKLRLISHWNLRDELKGAYGDPSGLSKQRLITQVMQDIVQQTVPLEVIDNPTLDWNPWTLEVTPTPSLEVDGEKSEAGTVREANGRYARILEVFAAVRKTDPYAPTASTAIDRAFEAAEIRERDVIRLLTDVLESPLAGKVAERIQNRLGRPLEPHDLWYDGFNPRAKLSQEALTRRTQERYPTPGAFAADIPRILVALGFPAEKARFIAQHIRVDPSRGAGHAMPAGRRGDFPRLRTRIGLQGMDYKGYNIAVHELGHNVEQVLSLYEIDHSLLAGVPNTAFTEALAFVFQARDLVLLGEAKKPDADDAVLETFWQTREIAAVALVDLGMWHWLYEHPDATPAELRDAVVELSRRTWKQYFAPYLGSPDCTLLGVYSHMISTPLYLFNYPLGHLIAFQLEERFAKAGSAPLGVEFERMVVEGAVTPDVWMVNATGTALSAASLLRATEQAVAR